MTISDLEALLARLRAATHASRVTARIDDESRGWSVNDVAAEALAPGIRSLRGMTLIAQRQAATARWIEAHRVPLVQGDVATADPRPPAALLEQYHVRAQVLAPIEVGHVMVGWLSVHECTAPRTWGADEQAAIRAAAREVETNWPVEPERRDGRS